MLLLAAASSAFAPATRVPQLPIVTSSRTRPVVALDISHLSDAYYAALETNYYSTTAAQAFLLVGMGDTISQGIETKGFRNDEYDLPRTLRMAGLGLAIAGFGTSTWLKNLEAALPGHSTAGRVLEKASLDACVWAPIANTLYLVLTPLLEGKSRDEVWQLCERRFVPVMQTELSTFFPYNLVSFSMIHPLYRPFTTGFVSMCFAVYISWITHNSPEDEQGSDANEVCVSRCPPGMVCYANEEGEYCYLGDY